MEIWKDIEGYEGLYQVSNLGQIKSLASVDNSGHERKEKIFKKRMHCTGYVVTTLCKNGICRMYRAHRIVATAFIFNPENKQEVNHIDGAKHNNIINNLEWVTSSENKFHAINIGLTPIGSNNKSSKLNEIDIPEIRKRLAKGDRVAQIARDYAVTSRTIDCITQGITWKHA